MWKSPQAGVYDNVFDDLDTTPVDFHYSEPCDISPDPPYDSYAATDPFTSLAGYDGTCNSMPGWNPSFNPSSAPGCKINPMYNEPGLGYGASYGSGARGASRQIMCRQMTHESRLSLYALASTGRRALSFQPYIAQKHMPHSSAALLASFSAFIIHAIPLHQTLHHMHRPPHGGGWKQHRHADVDGVGCGNTSLRPHFQGP